MDKKTLGAFVVGVLILFMGYKMLHHPEPEPTVAVVDPSRAPVTSAPATDGSASDLTNLAGPASAESQAAAIARKAAINPVAVPVKAQQAQPATADTAAPNVAGAANTAVSGTNSNAQPTAPNTPITGSPASSAPTTPISGASNPAANNAVLSTQPAAQPSNTAPSAPEAITKDYRQDPSNGLSDSELINLYTDQIAKNLKDGNAYYQRGLIYQKVKQYSAAIVDYSKAISFTKESANAYFNRGLCYEKRLEYDNAISDFNNALAIKNDDPRIYNARGLAFVEKGNLTAAEADYNKALQLDPNYDQAYFNLGTLYERKKKYQEALDAYTKAIEYNRQDKDQSLVDQNERKLEAYYRRAIMYLDLNQIEPALKDANYVIEQDPKNAKAYRVRAAIYTKAGNPGAAASDEVTAQNLGIEGMLQGGQ